ncbi:MAG: anthranilate phosphoribosyltransferase [Opitutaceae bacterium]|nr:anthranilate phosphoribosyltransferase [Opitutaceae bacterium]
MFTKTVRGVEFYALRGGIFVIFWTIMPLVSMQYKMAAGRDLSAEEAANAARLLALPGVPEGEKVGFLMALAQKGESAGEVAAFASVFRTLAANPGVEAWASQAIDIVGTGGDHAGGFNVSSMVVLLLACAGVPVMKHGNRAVTSKCGSADLLAALGVDLRASPDKQRRALTELGYVFFFAPNYHPAFQHIAPARKALAARGQRTIFNILGPLINPGRPAYVMMGAYNKPLASILAASMDALGAQAGLAGYGEIGPDRGVDELTTATRNHVRGFGRLADLDAVWRAEDFGLAPAPFSDLVGGDLPVNLAIVQALLNGRGPRGLVDTIVLNAAIGLWIVGKTGSVADGMPAAREYLLGGAVEAKLAATREFFRAS